MAFSKTFSLFICSLILIPTLSQLAKPDTRLICPDLHIGSRPNTDGKFDNLMANGEANPDLEGLVVSPYKTVDYLYIMDVNFELSQDNLNLYYDPEEHAWTQVVLKYEKKGWYIVEIEYNCDIYGGTLIDYSLYITVPNCGTGLLQWKKLCGNPMTEREGFTVEMSFDKVKQTIVRNGRQSTSTFYDMELGSFATVVPPFVSTIKFSMFLNDTDLTKENSSSVRSFGGIPQNFDKKFSGEVSVQKIKADANRFFVDPILRGDIIDGGNVYNDTDRVEFSLDLVCQGWAGNSSVEVDIILGEFRGVDIYFFKKCEGKDPLKEGVEVPVPTIQLNEDKTALAGSPTFFVPQSEIVHAPGTGTGTSFQSIPLRKTASWFLTILKWGCIFTLIFVVYATYKNSKEAGRFNGNRIPGYQTLTGWVSDLKDWVLNKCKSTPNPGKFKNSRGIERNKEDEEKELAKDNELSEKPSSYGTFQ